MTRVKPDALGFDFGAAGPSSTLGVSARSAQEIEAARRNVEAYAEELGFDEARTQEIADEVMAILGIGR